MQRKLLFLLTSFCNILRYDNSKILLVFHRERHMEVGIFGVPCQLHFGPVGIGCGCPVVALLVMEYLESDHIFVISKLLSDDKEWYHT